MVEAVDPDEEQAAETEAEEAPADAEESGDEEAPAEAEEAKGE